MAPVEERPNPQVELASSVEHGLLDILLDDPKRVCGTRENELLNVLDVSEYLNALALVEGSRLHQPDVVFAVLEGQTLLLAATVVDLLEAIHELSDLMIIGVA